MDESPAPSVAMSPDQCRMGRAAIDISQRQIEAICGVNKNRISEFESRKQRGGLVPDDYQRVMGLLMAYVEFIPGKDGVSGEGVQLKAGMSGGCWRVDHPDVRLAAIGRKRGKVRRAAKLLRAAILPSDKVG